MLIYTSGSTGRPKGVMLSHTNLDAMSSQMAEAMRITQDDHCLLILPLFHANALFVSFLTPIRAGGAAQHPRPLLRRGVRGRDRPAAADVLLSGADHLRHARVRPGRARGRLLVPPVRSVRRRPGLPGAADRGRRHARVRADRGLRPHRGHLRVDRQPARRPAAARHRRGGAARSGGRGDVRGRRAAAGRRAGRGGHPGRQRHGRLPRPPRGHGRDAARRMAPHRRRRHPRRRRLPPHRGPDQGPDHPRRREPLSEGDRGGADRAGRRPRGRRGRRARRYLRGGPGRLRDHLPRGHRRRRGPPGPVPRTAVPAVKVPVAIDVVDALPKNPVGKIDKPALRQLQAPDRISPPAPAPVNTGA